MFHSIRWRIAIPYVGLILVLMIGLSIYLSGLVRQTYLHSLENQLKSQAQLAANTLSKDFGDGSAGLNLDSLALKLADLLEARVTLIAADGTVIGESQDDRMRMDNHSNRPEIIQAKNSGTGFSTRFSHTEGYDMLYVAVPIQGAGGPLGYIRIAISLQEIQSNLQQIQRTSILITILAAIVAIALAFWIAYQTTRPLRELTYAAEKIASGDPSIRIIPLTSDEVGVLTRSFNLMNEKLGSKIKALETEQSKVSAVLNEMSDGVLILDQDGLIQLINPAAAAMFAVKPENAIGRSLIEALRQYQLVELWRKYREVGEPQSAIIEIPSQRLYLQCVVANLGITMPGSTLLLIQNLTRMRQLETIRQDFMSNISHELRTPLASLKALTETLLESALEDPPAARRFLLLMETEVDSLSLMVSELLELSRIEFGRVPLKLETVNSFELVNQAVERLSLQAQRAKLVITTDTPEDSPPVLADPMRLEQVLVNLLHNAIKFTPEDGTIVVGYQPSEDKICYYVKDSGIGIPESDIERIFERFYKTDRARSSGGTGLGLAISKHLVEAHGGNIWVVSIEGKGSTFFFTIPVSR